uniref:HIT domain-containing protein n=1 Tax=Sinocyclocheilus anshuiensis TaxID=1608454 RepID=A0A671NLT0_9TELE
SYDRAPAQSFWMCANDTLFTHPVCPLYKYSGDIVCFQDIDPGAPHHYLVIPKKHIHSCLSLQRDDINLGKIMSLLDVHLIIKLCITVL